MDKNRCKDSPETPNYPFGGYLFANLILEKAHFDTPLEPQPVVVLCAALPGNSCRLLPWCLTCCPGTGGRPPDRPNDEERVYRQDTAGMPRWFLRYLCTPGCRHAYLINRLPKQIRAVFLVHAA